MYHTLLVPLDGSAFGEQALPLALSLARRASATLRLVHVHVPRELMYVDSLSPAAHGQEARLLEHARAYLDGVVQRLTTSSSVPVTSTLLEAPRVAEAIRDHATATGTHLVVMTTHGHGPLSRMWLGSVADELVRRATLPTLLVRPREGGPEPAAEPLVRHLLIPLDGSALAERILEPAVALGTVMQAEYTLLRVVRPVVITSLDPMTYAAAAECEPTLAQLSEEARQYLERVAQRLRGQGLTVQTRVAVGGQPAVAILDEATARGADVIALETHARHGLPRLLLGSVADKVLRGASTPVLVQRPREE